MAPNRIQHIAGGNDSGLWIHSDPASQCVWAIGCFCVDEKKASIITRDDPNMSCHSNAESGLSCKGARQFHAGNRMAAISANVLISIVSSK